MPTTPTSLVVLGAGGDLTSRLLLPGLGALLADGGAPADLRLVGVGRNDVGDDAWRGSVREAFGGEALASPAAAAVADGARWVVADVTDPHELRAALEAGGERPALYFALPPAVTAAACRAALDVGLPPEGLLLLEKPYGTDLASARELDDLLVPALGEERLHRVDHFLGTGSVLGLLGLRLANRPLEVAWTADSVERVEVVWDETLALEGRAGYYDKAGALVDMLQSHLLQVLSLVAMEPPASLDASAVHDRQAEVLSAVPTPTREDVAVRTRRARYTAGSVGDRDVPAYADEEGVDADRGTETLAEVELRVDTDRWRDVPFVLRSGKGLVADRAEVVVTWRSGVLPQGFTGDPGRSRLRIGLDPDALSLELLLNGPGDPRGLERVPVGRRVPPADLPPYGEVLRAAFAGDRLLSVRGDVAQECWRVTDAVLAGWRDGARPLEEYPAGSDGPGGSLVTSGTASG